MQTSALPDATAAMAGIAPPRKVGPSTVARCQRSPGEPSTAAVFTSERSWFVVT